MVNSVFLFCYGILYDTPKKSRGKNLIIVPLLEWCPPPVKICWLIRAQNQGFNRIRTRDLRDTSAMLYQLSYEATCWERGQFIEFISWGVTWREVYMKYIWSPDFFRLLLSNCLNWKINCDDHSSLSSTTAVQIWIISYMLYILHIIVEHTCLNGMT